MWTCTSSERQVGVTTSTRRWMPGLPCRHLAASVVPHVEHAVEHCAEHCAGIRLKPCRLHPRLTANITPKSSLHPRYHSHGTAQRQPLLLPPTSPCQILRTQSFLPSFALYAPTLSFSPPVALYAPTLSLCPPAAAHGPERVAHLPAPRPALRPHTERPAGAPV
jgi:hypothetical protein